MLRRYKARISFAVKGIAVNPRIERAKRRDATCFALAPLTEAALMVAAKA
jgi:hypothetical protein